MKRFLLECGLFLALQGLILAALEAGVHGRLQRGFLAAWSDKQARLQSTPPPRLLLVGGSNLAMGVDSQLLERRLRRPVVNLGLNAGLGRELMLRQAESAVQPGDVLVVSLEYELFQARDPISVPVLLDLFDAAPSSLRCVPAAALPRILDGALDALAKRVRALPESLHLRADVSDEVYARAAFNVQGDAVVHRGRQPRLLPGRHVGLLCDSAELRPALQRLALFGAHVRRAGALAYLTAPPLPEEDQLAQAACLGTFWTLVDAEAGLPRLERELPSYSLQDFYDTPYHLRRQATRRRSLQLIEALRRVLPPRQAAPWASRAWPGSSRARRERFPEAHQRKTLWQRATLDQREPLGLVQAAGR